MEQVGHGDGQGTMVEQGSDLLALADGRRFATVLADPPWQFTNRTGKMAPEHRRLARYATLAPAAAAQAGR
jgi:hypothetical protein